MRQSTLYIAIGVILGCTSQYHENALQSLFEWVRSDDFDSIYLNNSDWADQILIIKSHPVFKQEKELTELRSTAEALYYRGSDYNSLSGSPYSELIEYALKDPEVRFLEHQKDHEYQTLYYRLIFRAPDMSPRIDTGKFVRERAVKVTLDSRGKFVRLETERSYDVLWDKIPQRIEWIEIFLPDEYLHVRIGCTGNEFAGGDVELGGSREQLGRDLGDPNILVNISEELSLKSGEPFTVKATVQFADGTTDSVQFEVVIPKSRTLFRATAPVERHFAYEIKSAEMRKSKSAFTEVYFKRGQVGLGE